MAATRLALHPTAIPSLSNLRVTITTGFIDSCLTLVEEVLSSRMPLNKRYIRNGRNEIVGSVTGGFSDGSSVVRDSGNRITGRTSDRFNTTRSNHNIVSIDSSDPGLLLDE